MSSAVSMDATLVSFPIDQPVERDDICNTSVRRGTGWLSKPVSDLDIGAERIPSGAPLFQDTVDRRAVLFDRAHSDAGDRE
jgi:hypothetical protein